MRIKRLRTDRGLSQAALAKKLGISRVHLANIEAPDDAPHHRTPSLALLEKLSKALRTPLADLMK
ncbi:MAG: helix-turn-helix transcriptional regulator [Candidatus Rokubacteria bacterium]|nr:helix-turn-helix transcriptional regulator [Candidatus Rokubacteria bacterium]MBI3109293.1 helix-turn-helix transcriptional regulator [Candidatus Rokubacteria bacterium]